MNSEAVRIRKNSLFSFFSIVSRLFTNVIIYWIIARFYGKEIFGQFTSAQTIAITFILFADFGIDLLLTTELPKNLKNRIEIFNRFFSIKIIFSIIAFLSMLSLGIWGDFNYDIRKLILIFSLFVLFSTLTNFFTALYKGSEKLEYETFVNFIINFISLIVILLLISLNENVFVISIAFTIAKLLGLIISLYYAIKIIPISQMKFHLHSFNKIKNQVFVFGVFWIFGNLFFQLDTILLTFWKSSESVGEYQAVFKLIMLPLIIPDIFINSILPTLSRLNIEDSVKWERLVKIFNKFLIVVSIPISITLFIFPQQIIHFIYGEKEYYESTNILQVFALILFVRFFSEVFGLILTTTGRQKTRMFIVVLGTIVNLLLNIFLIPSLGAFGASITSLITNIFVCVGYTFYSPHLLKNWIYELPIKKMFLITCIIVFAELLLKGAGLWYFSIIPIIIYFLYSYTYLLSPVEKKYFSDIKTISDIKIFKVQY